jgi:CheY-like chemotaxis protein
MKLSRVRSVLCVDDDESILRLLKAVLTTHGYRFMGASNGREALRFASQWQIDAVILDYLMPEIRGDVLAEALKDIRRDMPILMFSGSLDVPTLSAVDGFVAKGEGVNVLLATLERLLQSPHEHKPVRRFPRFPAQLRLAVTVARAGQLEMLHGTSTDVGEGGIGGIVDGDLEPGDFVLLTISDSRLGGRLEPRARVRYRNDNSYGFAFLDVSTVEQAAVRQFCGRLASG